MKMLNFTLVTVFIFYTAATFRSGCSLVFCNKVVLRLALVHSKYTGNREISVVRIPQWIKSPLLCNSSRQLNEKVAFWKWFYLTSVVLKIFGKLTGKFPWPLLQSLVLKEMLLTDVFLWIFQTCFRTAIFIKHFWPVVSVFPTNTKCFKQQIPRGCGWKFRRFQNLEY